MSGIVNLPLEMSGNTQFSNQLVDSRADFLGDHGEANLDGGQWAHVHTNIGSLGCLGYRPATLAERDGAYLWKDVCLVVACIACAPHPINEKQCSPFFHCVDARPITVRQYTVLYKI